MNLNKVVKQFLEENDDHKLSEKLVVIRQDGISIYSNIENELEAASVGALIGGVWQAAQALSELTKKGLDHTHYRLGFDTSSDGLYILPLTIMNDTYYLGGIYTDTNNPAKLKQNMKLLKNNLELFLSEFSIKEEKKSGFLFQDISDDEMDNLFSFGGV